MKNFWKELTHPVFILAPMEEVTDSVFREIVLGISDPSVLKVVFTEFTSTDGLQDPRAFARIAPRLHINDSERRLLRQSGIRIVAQIWGSDPDKFYRTAAYIDQTGDFDGIDINMGCPAKKMVKKGGCSALIKDPVRAAEIIQAAKAGGGLPVSVKTRLGWNRVITEEWTGHLLSQGLSALTVHGRTQAQQSDGQADWREIAKAARLRDSLNPDTLVFGNGDVLSYAQGLQLRERYGLDGVMVGRGVFHDPWIFHATYQARTPAEGLALMRRHIELFTATWGREKNYNILKRFFKIYIHGFPGAADLRAQVMETRNAEEAYAVLDGVGEKEGVV